MDLAVNRPLLFFLFLSISCSGQPCLADETSTIAPERKISVVFNDPEAPAWKILWDEARELVRKGDLYGAEEKYSRIHDIKPNIEEVNWEYCKVLLETGAFGKVSKIISGLLEISPRNIDYLLVGGRMAQTNKDYALAGRYFGTAFQLDPVSTRSDIALAGFIQSLRGQGKNNMAFPLQEQLILRSPGNSQIVHEAAVDAQQLHMDKKARLLYEKLLEQENVDDRVIYQASKVFDVPGYEQKTAELREEYVKRHPDYLSFHKLLAEYYLQTGDATSALEHLTSLAEHNDEYLIQTGKVYFYELGRPDRALLYFEKYLGKHPEDINVNQTIEEIQTFLANEFLAIVENDGALPLWKDLIKVTANRLAIYMKMADILEQKGRTKELIEILSIIHNQYPDNDIIAFRIVNQYLVINDRESALNYLEKITSSVHRNSSYYTLKGDIEDSLGRELDALVSYEKGLELDLKNSNLRAKCVKLAGSLGLVDKMRFLFIEGVQETFEKPTAAIVLNYLDQLARNYLFHEYELACENYQYLFEPAGVNVSYALHKARTYRSFGHKRRAEQLLRESLLQGSHDQTFLFELAQNAIEDKNRATAREWRDTLANAPDRKKQGAVKAGYELRLALLDAKFLLLSGEYERAVEIIETKKERYSAVLDSSTRDSLLRMLDTELCRLYFYRGDYAASYQVFLKLHRGGTFDAEIAALANALNSRDVGAGPGSIHLEVLYETDHPVTSRFLEMISTELKMQEYEDARLHLKVISEVVPESIIGRIQFVELLVATRQFDRAVEDLQKLVSRFPLEPYFYELWIETETRRGDYEKGIVILQQQAGIEGLDALVVDLAGPKDTKRLLTLARLVWSEKKYEDALSLYRNLLSPSVVEVLSDEFQKREINYLDLVKEDTFWSSMFSLLQSEPEVVTELMAPSFLMDNRENDAAEIVAENFARFSWQKMILYEYLARKAVFERRYAYAEQNYKRLFEEEENPTGLMDLASIYGKFGKYRKEAQIYETIQSQGTTTPGLEDSIERNTLLIRPQSTIDVGYIEKDGREGSLNITQATGGTSFLFTPELDKDIKLTYSYNQYGAVDSDETVIGNYLFSSGVYEFAKDYELELGVGGEKVDSEGNATLLYSIALRGQLDQTYSLILNYNRSQVADTLDSVKEQTTSENVVVGLECETPVGLTLGGTVRHREYNDNNSQDAFHGYSYYNYYIQDLEMSFLYDFHYINGTGGDDDDGLIEHVGFLQNRSLYWNPSTYTEHLLTFRFKHDFFGHQDTEHTDISYYSFDNAVGYEDNEVFSYLGSFNIFLEMSPQFLLKGTLTFSTSSVYEEKGFFLGLHYRW